MSFTADSLTADLAMLLGPEPVENDRARLVIDLALERVGAVITPIPDVARPIVLDVAVRGYTNPRNVTSEGDGPFNRTYQPGGVYLTAQEKTDLEEMVAAAGPSEARGAFSVTPWSSRQRALDSGWC